VDAGWELVGVVVVVVAAVAAFAFAFVATAGWFRAGPVSGADKVLAKIWPVVTRAAKSGRRASRRPDQHRPPPRRSRTR
jgi:hypothetical protein